MTTSDGSLRPEIEASWRRSARSGVRTSALAPGAVDVDLEHRLLQVATPVLDRLAEELLGTGVSVVLTDATAGILARRAGSRRLDGALDLVGVAPGYSYAEEAVGTNGMGTAAEERRPVQVRGEEHFSEHLKDLTCVGVPITNPISGVVEGVLDLTCFNADASPMLLPFLLEAARDVERRLGDGSTAREQLLLDHFLRATRRTTRPIVAVGEQVVITNSSAARLIGPADHPMLWEAARAALAGHERPELELILTDGRPVVVRCDGVHDGRALVGATLAVDLAAATVEAEPAAELPGLAGRSAPWMRVVSSVHALAAQRGPVLVAGPPGSGRTSVALALASRWGAAPVVVDAERDPHGAAEALQGRWPVAIVQHVDHLAQPVAAPGVIATASGPGALGPLVPTIAVPSLRDRLDDLDLLVDALRRRRGGHASRTTPALLQVLLRAPWPGNVAELDGVVAELLARRPVGELVVEDLPARLRPTSSRRPLSTMERAECEAIAAALERCDGNKVEAARDLGIARSTLYRKLVAYGLDEGRTGF